MNTLANIISKSNNYKRRSPANGSNTSSVGGVTSLILFGIVMCSIVLQCNTSSVYATASTLSLSISNSNIVAHAATNSTNGSFVKSASSTITASTNNVTGYKLMLAATNNNGTSSSDYNKLINSSDSNTSTNHLDSISSSVSESDFSANTTAAGTAYNGKWGYYSSMHNSTDNTSTEYYYPAPTTSGDLLNETACANGTTNCPNSTDTYELAIGARVDASTKLGAYSNTFVVYLVAQAVSYSLTYVDNIVGNMPVDEIGNVDSDTLTISSNTPKRDGYSFLGWCTVKPVTNLVGSDTCTGGTTVAAGGTVSIDQTGGANNFTLYAMWSLNEPANDNIYMQNVADWGNNLAVGQEVMAIDARDGKTYTVARLCMSTTVPATAGSCNTEDSMLWMTQNLDLIVGPEGVATLSSTDSDINTNLNTTSNTDQGYSTASNGVITWTPKSTMNTPKTISNHASGNPANSTNWQNDSAQPYQAEGGDYYVYTYGDASTNDYIYDSRFACITAGHTDAECHHYHIGNYYNWSAAVALNSSGEYTDTIKGNNQGDNYAVMPNSICPAGWRLPNGLTKDGSTTVISEFNQLALAYGITTGTTTLSNYSSGAWDSLTWATNGFVNFRTAPLYFVRSGGLDSTMLRYYGTNGYLWSSTSQSKTLAYGLVFDSGGFYPAYQTYRYDGFPVRCVAR